jgi:hypothetical protein
MNEAEFEPQLSVFAPVLGPETAKLRCGDRDFWDSIGTHVLDHKLTRLANFYMQCNATQRRRLRRTLSHAASWELVAYVRRMGLDIALTEDHRWLVSALSIASLENAKFDHRDSIVSLVIARAGSEHASIAPMPYFDKAIALSSTQMKPYFINARDHSPVEVRGILREFGPPQLNPGRQKRTR